MSVPMLSGGQKAFASAGSSHSLSTPLARFACRIRFSICASCTLCASIMTPRGEYMTL